MTVAHSPLAQERKGTSASDLQISSYPCKEMPAHPSVDLRCGQGGEGDLE